MSPGHHGTYERAVKRRVRSPSTLFYIYYYFTSPFAKSHTATDRGCEVALLAGLASAELRNAYSETTYILP